MSNFTVAREELLRAYDQAIELTRKEDITFYTALRKKLNAIIGNNYAKWENYMLICENYSFLEFNLSMVAVIISLATLAAGCNNGWGYAILIVMIIVISKDLNKILNSRIQNPYQLEFSFSFKCYIKRGYQNA